MLGRRRFLDALAIGALGACASPPRVRPPAALGGKRVVMISIDGMRPEYHRTPDAYGLQIPHLRRLAAEGASAEGLESVWPTVTYPAHTTMVTGVVPARHGVAANTPFDPEGASKGQWRWYAEEIRVRALWDATREAGLASGAMYWPVTVGAAIDWNVPQIWRSKTDFDDALLRALSTPGLAREVSAAIGALPAEHRSDDVRARAAAWLVREKRPHLTLAYLTDLDSAQHEHGPFSAQALATLERIDAGVGAIVEAARVAGTYDGTTFVVLSDHGFLPVTRTIRPYVLFAKEGLLDLIGTAVKGWRAAPLVAGGSCGVVLSDASPALRAHVGDVLARVAADRTLGIRKLYTEEENAALGGFAGCAFALDAEDGFEFSSSAEGPAVGPSDHAGTHGYAPSRSELRASLIVSGRGVRRGASLGVPRMIDVAPTVARLLGVSLPDATGKAIDAALA